MVVNPFWFHGKWTSVHHPFTLPKSSVEDVKSNPGEALSVAYDMVLNGTEVGGGSCVLLFFHQWNPSWVTYQYSI